MRPVFSEIPEWPQEFRENLVDERVPETQTHTRVLLVSHLENSRDERCRANTVFILTSRKTKIGRSDKGLKISRTPYRRRTGEVVLRAEMFGALITADHNIHWRMM